MYEIHTNKIIVINVSTFQNFRNNLKRTREKERHKTIGFTSTDDDLNRKILEKEKVDIFIPLLANRKDFQKQRNSGFNHVLAKIAKKTNIIIGINLDEIVKSKVKEKANLLARVRQNIKLCNKNKLKMLFVFSDKNKTKIKDFNSSVKMTNERNIHDLKALGLVLAMPTWMTKSL